MTPKDVCVRCDGVGQVVNFDKAGVMRFPWVIVCPVCDGIGWDPAAVRQELQAQQSALEDIKL